MRIENQSAKSVGENVRSTATRPTGSESPAGHAVLSHADNDNVSLSSASSLINLAKSLPSYKQSKIDALTQQFKAGTYRADSASTSRSLVGQHVGVRGA